MQKSAYIRVCAQYTRNTPSKGKRGYSKLLVWVAPSDKQEHQGPPESSKAKARPRTPPQPWPSHASAAAVAFAGTVAGSGEIVCATSPCRIQDGRVFVDSYNSAHKHHSLYHDPELCSAMEFFQAYRRWVEPYLPLPEGLEPSPHPQLPMADVPVVANAFKCTVQNPSWGVAQSNCSFVSLSLDGLRTHARSEHHFEGVRTPAPAPAPVTGDSVAAAD